MNDEAETGDALEQAANRLEQAIAQLEQRLNGATGAVAADADSAKLAAELDASRARERELSEAGEQASKALGRAIAEIRAALANTEPQAGAA